MRAVAFAAVILAASHAHADPNADLERVVRAHLGDVALRTCLTASDRGEHVVVIGVPAWAKRGKGEQTFEGTDTGGDLHVTNCLNGFLAPLTYRRIDPAAEITVRFVVDAREVRMELVREPVRWGYTGGRLDLVAGALGGVGFRDGLAREARFGLPIGIAVDHGRSVVIADRDNFAIRRIDRATGETFGVAAIPDIQQPVALAFDGPGRLYVLDRLRGNIWRVGGGKAEQLFDGEHDPDPKKQLRVPSAFAFDADGTVVIADSGNQRIVRANLATGAIVEIAGTFGAKGARDGAKPLFDYPEGLALDGAGHAYVTEWGNHDVRVVTLATGETHTLAGRAGAAGHIDGAGDAARFDAPSSIAFERGQLYVAESGGVVVRQIEIASRKVTTVAGAYKQSGDADGIGRAARFDHYSDSALGEVPLGIAVADGELYVADSGNHVVRSVIPATGAVTTLAGAPHDEHALDARAVIIGKDASMYATAGEAVMRIVDGKASLVAGSVSEMGHRDGVGAAARFRGPFALASAPDGALIAAEVNGEVRRVDPKSGAVKQLANLDRLIDSLAVEPDGTILVGGQFDIIALRNGKLSTIAALAPRITGRAAAPLIEAELDTCYGLAADGDVIYCLDAHVVREGFDGAVVTLRRFDRAARTHSNVASWRVLRAAGHVQVPRGLAITGGTAYVTFPTGVVTRIDLATGKEQPIVATPPTARGVTLGISPSLSAPAMPFLTPTGDLLIVDEHAILKLREQR